MNEESIVTNMKNERLSLYTMSECVVYILVQGKHMKCVFAAT